MITLDECHADHAPPYTFATLANLLIAARARDFPQSATVVLTEWPSAPYRPRLANRELAEDWRRFHHRPSCTYLAETQSRACPNSSDSFEAPAYIQVWIL
jgi:hypothetical protein